MTPFAFATLLCFAAGSAFLIGLAIAAAMFARPRQIRLGHFGERHDD